jgi:hypothetical protein
LRNSDRRNTNVDIPDGVINEIMDEMVEMSGLVVFRVRGTFVNRGPGGELDEIVIARDPIEAMVTAWGDECASDLRTINAEWICPVESVKKSRADETEDAHD